MVVMYFVVEVGIVLYNLYKGGLKEDMGMVGLFVDLVLVVNRVAEEKFGVFTYVDLRECDEFYDRLFEVFDFDGDGCVMMSELCMVLEKIWDMEMNDLCEEVYALMEFFDVN